MARESWSRTFVERYPDFDAAKAFDLGIRARRVIEARREVAERAMIALPEEERERFPKHGLGRSARRFSGRVAG